MCKIVSPDFYLGYTALLYVTFTGSGCSFELVLVNTKTVNGNLRKSGRIPEKKYILVLISHGKEVGEGAERSKLQVVLGAVIRGS